MFTAEEMRQVSNKARANNEGLNRILEEIENDIQETAEIGKNYVQYPLNWFEEIYLFEMARQILKERGFTITYCMGTVFSEAYKNPDYWVISW